MSYVFLLLVLLPPFASFTLIGVVSRLRKNKLLAPCISIFSIALSTVSSIVLFVRRPEIELLFEWIPAKTIGSIYFGFFLDRFTIVMFFVVCVVALMAQVYSLGYMKNENPSSLGRYYTFHSLFAFAMLGFVSSSSLLQIYIFWELVGLCSYLLIGFWYYKPEAVRAATKAFWITRFGDVGFAIGMIVLWGATGTFLISDIFLKAPELSTGFLSVCLLLVFFGAIGKSAQFPLHVWLPDAMEGPTPVSALIHAATMVVAGVYLVIRLYPLFQIAPEILTLVLWIGSITALIGASLAMIQEDIKRVLAYSTVSQIGYMMAVMGAGGKDIAFFHLFNHAFFKALLFLAAGSVIHSLGTNNIWNMGKLARKMPQTSLLFLTGALALSGVFPFSGFFSKDEILLWVYNQGYTVPFIILIVSAFLTAFYIFRVFFLVFMGEERSKETVHESPWNMTIPMWILGILALVSGLPRESFYEFLNYNLLLPHNLLAYLSPVVPVIGIGVAWLIYQKKTYDLSRISGIFSPLYSALDKKLWLDDLYEWIYRRVLEGLSFTCGWFDRYIVDGFVNVVSLMTRRSSQILREIQTGYVQEYLYGIIVAIALFVFLSLTMSPLPGFVTQIESSNNNYQVQWIYKDIKELDNNHGR